MKVKQKTSNKPLYDIDFKQTNIDYKGWKIQYGFMVDKKEACIIISNPKIKISHKVVRKCHRSEVHWYRKVGNFLFSREEEEVQINYLELETLDDLIVEAKYIVDMYELMKEQILKETQIIETPYSFEKIEFVKKSLF